MYPQHPHLWEAVLVRMILLAVVVMIVVFALLLFVKVAGELHALLTGLGG